MSQKLPVDGFKWVKDISSLNKKTLKIIKLVKNYDEESNKGHIFEEDIEYPKDLHDLNGDLLFLPERMKINKYNYFVRNL